MDVLKEMSGMFYNESIKLINKGNLSEARELLIQAYTFNDKDVDIMNLLGLCCYNLCQFHESYFLWNKSVLIDKKSTNRALRYLVYIKSPEYNRMLQMYNSGKMDLERGKLKSAMTKMDLVSEAASNFLIEPQVIKALIHAERGEYVKAQEQLENILLLDRGNDTVSKYYKEVTRVLEENSSPGKKTLVSKFLKKDKKK